ncbi:hypothetical protein [Proteiniborus sp. MB09-C3]|uniref:hypothetical protein n=1 Tax=Proteiniborus sp. MB09-C3 TaxID=3050072 RepID=UPI002555DA77|nr:hypothetical protein [Proteiniborus sp. MB09-C3]WIV10526.1 hypothetical protein QO263_10175 [Proteiniborus sp. MB09-C3]
MSSNIKLKQGQVIKNYKELCSLLDLEVKDGNSKIAQMKEIERFYKLRKDKYKLIVDEVYSEPLLKVDGRVNNGGHIGNTKYDDLMDKIIINLLITYDGYIEESYSSLIDYYFDFFTPEYKKLFDMGYRRYAKLNKMSSGLVMTYQQKIKGVIETALETSLERLQRNGIITYSNEVKINNEEFADKKMQTLISKTEQKVYDELNMTPFDRSIPSKNKQFKKQVCNYLDIWTYYNVYVIKLKNRKIQEVEDDEEELKQRFIKSVVDATKRKTSKGKDGKYKPYSYGKYAWEIDKLTKLLWKLPDGYISEYDAKLLLAGKDISNTEEQQKEHEISNSDIENYNTYYDYGVQDLQDNIPF